MRTLSAIHNPDSQMSVKITSAIQEFKIWQISKSHTESNIKHYAKSFSKLMKFCEQNELVNVEDISRAKIRQWQVELLSEVTRLGTVTSPRSIVGYMRDLKAFLNWCVTEEYLIRNPIKSGDMPVVPSKLPTHITKEEWEKLIELTSGKDSISRRNQALIRIMLDTGIRLTELANLTFDDVDMNSGEIIIRKGKGQKMRMVMIGTKSLMALRKYMVLADLNPGDSLWVGTQGFITREGITMIIKNLLKKAGIVGKGNCHLFRRTCAIQYLRAGESTLHVQSILGHADGQAMKHYISLVDSDTRDSVRRSSPSDKWG